MSQATDIKQQMEQQAGIGDATPQAPEGTVIVPEKISSEGTIQVAPEALEAQDVQAAQTEAPLQVTPPIKKAAAQYEAYVAPGTPEAQAVKVSSHLKLSSETFKVRYLRAQSHRPQQAK